MIIAVMALIVLILCGPTVALVLLAVVGLIMTRPDILAAILAVFLAVSALFFGGLMLIGVYQYIIRPIYRAMTWPFRRHGAR